MPKKAPALGKLTKPLPPFVWDGFEHVHGLTFEKLVMHLDALAEAESRRERVNLHEAYRFYKTEQAITILKEVLLLQKEF